MNKGSIYVFFAILYLSSSCKNEITSVTPQSNSDSSSVVDSTNIQPTLAMENSFQSEPGLFKMIRENYPDQLIDSINYLVIPIVSGCSCSLLSFEEIDSHLTAFKSNQDVQTFWLIKGEDDEYVKDIAKKYPNHVLLPPPTREFKEYGLFQNSNLIFEIADGSKITNWLSVE